MSSYGLLITTWDGHNINDGTNYDAQFLVEDSKTLDTFTAQAVEVTRPGSFPVPVRSRPDGLTLGVEIVITNVSQANLDQLKEWFDPTPSAVRYLKAKDQYSSSGEERQIGCTVLSLAIKQNLGANVFLAQLRAATGVWEDVSTATPDSEAVGSGMGETLSWSISNAGSTETPVSIALTPSVAKDATLANNKRQRVVIANKSPRALNDPVARGYPILLSDLSALTTPITPGDDVRLIVNGEEWPSYIEGNNFWASLPFAPRKIATLGTDISDSDLSLTVSNFDGFNNDRWPDRGFLLLGTECIQYTDRGHYSATIVRGARNTTAASHTAGDTLYWVERPFIDIVYGWSSPDAPLRPDEEKPVIDLASSDNTSHVWPATFLQVPGEKRSRCFQSYFTDQGVGSQHTRQYGDGTSLVFENNQPAAGKPGLNDAVIDFPVPLAGPLVLDENVGLTMLLQVHVSDQEQYESLLVDQRYTPSALTTQSFSLPADVSKARITGSVGVVTGNGNSTASALFTSPTAILEQWQRTCVKFPLTQETKGITALGVQVAKESGATGDLRIYIMEDGGGLPAVDVVSYDSNNDGTNDTTTFRPHVVAGFFIANADLATSAGGALPWTILDLGSLTLNAGTYWVSFARFTGGTGNFLVGYGTGNFVTVVETDINDQDHCISFLVFSDQTEPQDDAPFDNGDTVEVANITAPLDSAYAPAIVIADEEDMYLFDETLENMTRSESLKLFFPCALGKSLTLNTGADRHEAIDQETGLNLQWAIADASNPDRWLMLGAGNNDIEYTGTGVTGLAAVTTWRPCRL